LLNNLLIDSDGVYGEIETAVKIEYASYSFLPMRRDCGQSVVFTAPRTGQSLEAWITILPFNDLRGCCNIEDSTGEKHLWSGPRWGIHAIGSPQMAARARGAN
jgi:hypothetical protein